MPKNKRKKKKQPKGDFNKLRESIGALHSRFRDRSPIDDGDHNKEKDERQKNKKNTKQSPLTKKKKHSHSEYELAHDTRGEKGKSTIEVSELWTHEATGYVPSIIGIGGGGGTVFGATKQQEWVELNLTDLNHLQDVYDSDPNIRIAVDIDIGDMLNGQILFKREGKELLPAAAAWNSRVWIDWLRKVMRSIWTWGFVLVSRIPHPEFGWEPRIFNLPSRSRVMYRQSIMGKPQFAVQIARPSSEGKGIFLGSENMEFVSDVHVFCVNPPTRTGRITSKVAAVWLEKMVHLRVLDIGMRAYESRAAPRIVTESMPDDYGSKVQADGFSQNSRGGGGGIHGGGGSGLGAMSDIKERHAMADTIANLVRIIGKPAYDALSTEGGGAGGGEESTTFDLPTRRRYVSATLAEAPQDLLKWVVYHQQMVLMIWGIPPSVIQIESSRGRASMDLNTQHLVRLHRDQNKHLCIEMVKAFYHILYDTVYRTQYLLSAPWGAELDTDGSSFDPTKIDILMPGIPSSEVTRDLYVRGILKYEAYIRYISATESIPLEDMHATPQLTLQELNGIKEEKKDDDPGAAADKNYGKLSKK